MDIKAILAHLNTEKATLDAAIKALQALNGTSAKRGRPANGRRRGRRRLSAAATTMRYLKPNRNKAVRQKVNETFAGRT